MLVATYYTPSHAAMARRYVFDRLAFAGFGGCVSHAEEIQTCESGQFKSEGWNQATAAKLAFLSSLPCDGRPMLFCDADVALMPGLAAWCEDHLEGRPPHWIGYADDVVQWCSGVILFRCVRPVLDWFRFCHEFCLLVGENDQDGLHILRANAKALPVEPGVLPGDRVCNWATVSAPEIPAPWDGEAFRVPATCLAWHANWTVGVERKTRMLERVVLHGGQHRDY